MEQRELDRFAAAGMLAPVLFVVVFTFEGALRAGYDPMGMYVSELALGERGWIQIVSFLLTGILIFVFGHGLRKCDKDTVPSKAGPVALQIIGGGFAVSGLFPTDSSAMFTQRSQQGTVHTIIGAVVFSLMPVACLAFFRSARKEPQWRGFARGSLAAGVLIIIGIGLLKTSEFPDADLFAWKGLLQRFILLSFMTWLFVLAAKVRRMIYIPDRS